MAGWRLDAHAEPHTPRLVCRLVSGWLQAIGCDGHPRDDAVLAMFELMSVAVAIASTVDPIVVSAE
jgi:hypothetical protein